NVANETIADLALAPRNAAGLVEYVADFYVLKPVDGARGNRRLLLDIPNRGRKVVLGMLNSTVRVPDPTMPEDFGNGFLMRHGFTVAWCGWQPDVPRQDGLMVLAAPTARGDAGPIGGPVLCEWRPNVRATTLPLADRYHIPYRTADLDDPAARLTVREHAGAPAVALPRSAWRFADPSHVSLHAGFEPGKIYELVYRAENPPLVGLGLAAVRDTGAGLRFAAAAAGNPCAGGLDRAYVFGVSQSGRFLRHLLFLGLNEDETGRRVFDGAIPHVAGAQHTPGTLPPPAADPNTGSRGLHRFNVVDYAPLLRAVLVNLDRWVSDGVEPPASSVPRIADGTAVAAATARPLFSRLPGAR